MLGMSASWGIEPGYIAKEFADLKRDTIRVRRGDPFTSQVVITGPFFVKSGRRNQAVVCSDCCCEADQWVLSPHVRA
jgi:hypothetical protein